jgi:ribosomal-protein-alanine N-acetyltransferase
MADGDLDTVARLEQAAAPIPWTRRAFANMMAVDPSICLVCEVDDEVVGYLVARQREGAWYLNNLLVDPRHRRHGVATELLGTYVESSWLVPSRGHTLEVRVSNAAAIALYRSLGFRIAGLRPAFYPDNNEDAFVMRKDWRRLPWLPWPKGRRRATGPSPAAQPQTHQDGAA